MKVTLNGNIKEIPAKTTVAELLGQIGTTPERVAVELNLDVVPRGNYASTAIREGDSIEVVTFVGGG